MLTKKYDNSKLYGSKSTYHYIPIGTYDYIPIGTYDTPYSCAYNTCQNGKTLQTNDLFSNYLPLFDNSTPYNFPSELHSTFLPNQSKT